MFATRRAVAVGCFIPFLFQSSRMDFEAVRLNTKIFNSFLSLNTLLHLSFRLLSLSSSYNYQQAQYLLSQSKEEGGATQQHFASYSLPRMASSTFDNLHDEVNLELLVYFLSLSTPPSKGG